MNHLIKFFKSVYKDNRSRINDFIQGIFTIGIILGFSMMFDKQINRYGGEVIIIFISVIFSILLPILAITIKRYIVNKWKETKL